MATKTELMNTTALHAELSASTAERWFNCPGSIRMIRLQIGAPVVSIYARRGTAMHKAAAQWLSTDQEPDWAIETFDGFELEPDEIEAVQLYVKTVTEDLDEYGGELMVEHRFSLEKLRPGMFGTNDAMIIRCADGVLRVYDFKGGAGITVEVVKNLQMLYYGLGALVNIPKLEINDLELVIVQPRARHPDGPVRRWRIDLIDSADWAQDLLDAAAATDDPNAPLHAGEWCRFCVAAGSCKEYERYALHSAELDFSVIEDERGALPDPKMMTPEQIGQLLPMLHVLEDWISVVRVYAHAEAEAGRCPPGHKLVQKRGRRQWSHPENVIVSTLHGRHLSDEDIFETKLRSPAQVEKKLARPDRFIVNQMAEMISSGTNLAPFDDPRPAVEGTGLAVFSALPGGSDENKGDTS